MRLIDADAIHSTLADWQLMLSETYGTNDEFVRCLEDVLYTVDNTPTIAAPRWHRVEDDPPDEKTDAIFYYEWTGISGTVYRETSIISLNELMALGCRPIAWMPSQSRRSRTWTENGGKDERSGCMVSDRPDTRQVSSAEQ